MEEQKKSLDKISWQVTEDEYRSDNALSYSTLAKYERGGFNNLDTLFDKVESPSLTFGSVVDTLITGNEDEFNEKFLIADLSNNLSDTLTQITKRLFTRFSDKYKSLVEIPDNELLDNICDIPWNNHWLDKTRVKKIKEDCAGYYSLLYVAGNRSIIDSTIRTMADNAVQALKSSPATKFYFEPNNAFDDSIQRFYQLKFKIEFNGVPYRCMADELIVLEKDKIIVPIDLKTSSKPEWDFFDSFINWSYSIQARLYWRIIRYNLDKDPYFKDFKLLNYKFIVVNKNTLTPLVWDFKHTTAYGSLYIPNKDIELRDPFIIGEELSNYLKNKPKVPNGISIDKINNIEDWIKVEKK